VLDRERGQVGVAHHRAANTRTLDEAGHDRPVTMPWLNKDSRRPSEQLAKESQCHLHWCGRFEDTRIGNDSKKATERDRRKCKGSSAVSEVCEPCRALVMLRRVLAVRVNQNVDVGEIHRSAAAAVTCYVVLLDQNRAPIDIEAGEEATLPERNELERLPRIAAGVRAGGKTDRLFDEPADRCPFPCRTLSELAEELVVDGDRGSHDGSG